jgi:hypothetical protein
MTEPRDPRVGDPVILRGRIVSINEGVALVEVYRTWPVGMTIPVQCGALEHDERPDRDGGQESEADAIQRTVDEATANPGHTAHTRGGGK